MSSEEDQDNVSDVCRDGDFTENSSEFPDNEKPSKVHSQQQAKTSCTAHCEVHPRDNICGNCNKCDKHVCSKSMIRTCNPGGHMVTHIDEVIEKKRQDVEKILRVVKDSKLRSLETMMMEINRKDEENEEATSMVHREINTKISTQLVTRIQREVQKYSDHIERNKAGNKARLDNVRVPIKECINEVREQVANLNKTLQQNPGFQLFEMEQTILKLNRDAETALSIEIPKMILPKFIFGTLTSENVGDMLGKLTIDGSYENEKKGDLDYLTELTVEREFNVGNSGIFNVIPTDATHAWILCYSKNLTTVWRFDPIGKDTKCVNISKDFSVSNVSISEDSLYIAFPEERRIVCIPSDSFSEPITLQRSKSLVGSSPFESSLVTTVLKFGDLKPYGLAMSSTFPTGIWVGLVDILDYNLNPNKSKRMIACYSTEGREIYSVKNDNYEGKPLFTIPRRLAVNNESHNVVTTNLLSHDHGEIILTDNIGSVIAIYPKRTSTSKFVKTKINPTDVSFTQLGDVIFADNHNKCVTILDHECQTVLRHFKGFVCSSIGTIVDENMSIWLGKWEGKLFVCSYLGLKENLHK